MAATLCPVQSAACVTIVVVSTAASLVSAPLPSRSPADETWPLPVINGAVITEGLWSGIAPGRQPEHWDRHKVGKVFRGEVGTYSITIRRLIVWNGKSSSQSSKATSLSDSSVCHTQLFLDLWGMSAQQLGASLPGQVATSRA